MDIQHTQKEINVGVDTGKFQLDFYIRPLGIAFAVTNDENGIRKAIGIIKKHQPTRVIVEATGRLEHTFVCACAKANLPFVIANPVHIKKFGGAIGRIAKTDPLDAKLIAHYGEAVKPRLSQLRPALLQQMSDLLARRRQLLNMQTMEKNRRQIMPKALASTIKPMLTALGNQIDKVDRKLHVLIESCEDYKAKNDIIQSMPGIGNVVALSLISNMPELGYISNKEVAALIGVAPMNKEIGRYEGRRKIRGGRAQIRTVMYMAMMSAIQCNPVFKATYNKLLAAGKTKKSAIIACVRKMIVMLNSMVRDGALWDPKLG
ncbi:IS110 family transposase [Marinobacter sp. 1Y8]